MIELIRVTKKYSHNKGIQDISFKVEKGEWVAIIGPAGAGKSTILRLIYGYDKPDEGEIIVGTHRLSGMKPRHGYRLRKMLGIVDQDLSLLDDRTVVQNVLIVGQLLGWPAKRSRNTAFRLLNQVGLFDQFDNNPMRLSYGERRRLAIARAMFTDPFALIADEPLGHLDRETALDIVAVFSRFHDRGTTLLMATHREELFSGYPVRLVRIENGRIVSDA